MDTTQDIGIHEVKWKNVKVGWWYTLVGQRDYDLCQPKTGNETISPDAYVEVWD